MNGYTFSKVRNFAKNKGAKTKVSEALFLPEGEGVRLWHLALAPSFLQQVMLLVAFTSPVAR